MPSQPPLGDRRRAAARAGRPAVGPSRLGLGQPAGPLGRGPTMPRRQLVGDRRGDPVDQLVGLVDDEHVVLGQHLAALEGVDGHEASGW